MLDCAWLERLWTFQELMLSTNPVMVYGDQFIPWSSFVASVVRSTPSVEHDIVHSQWITLIQTWMSVARPVYWRGRRMRCTGLVDLFFGWIRPRLDASTSFRDHWLGSAAASTTIALCLCGVVMSSIFMVFLGTSASDAIEFDNGFGTAALIFVVLFVWVALFASIPVITSQDIYGVLPETAVSAATLRTVRYGEGRSPHDRDFAVQGVLQTLGLRVTPVPNYASLARVYRTFFADLLTWRSLNALLDAGLPTSKGSPSWTPRFDLAATKKWIDLAFLENYKCQVYPDPPTCKCPNFDVRYVGVRGRRSCEKCRRYYKGVIHKNFLFVCGAYLDMVAFVCNEFIPHAEGGSSSRKTQQEFVNLKTMLKILATVQRNFQANNAGEMRFDLRLRLMQMLYARPSSKISQADVSRYRAWFSVMATHWSEWKDEAVVRRCYEKLQRSDELLHTHETFCSSFIQQRICFLTQNMRVGCASTFVKPNDVIVVVPTVSMPLVLRPALGGCWQLIGPSFISVLMDGESCTCDKPQTLVLV